MKNHYITTPIYYVNANPHIGHAYTSIIADVFTRYYKMFGYKVFFSTGTDEHGDKIVKSAEEIGKTPQEWTDEISKKFQDLLPKLNIENDIFIRTTDEKHKKNVTDMLQKIYDKGDIYFSSYKGLYCYGCERYYNEDELIDGKCPDHGTEPELINEENYFFKMSNYQEWLIDYINNNPDFIRPKHYKNEVLGFLREPLKDLCISRPKSRLKWGIELPFDKNFVTYVWFDALLNYLTVLDYPNGEKYKQYWSVSEHFIAKDILKPHAIYWPCMLKSAGIDPYKHLSVHGYWNMKDRKISKSIGNVINPLDLGEKYGVDSLRYFLLREMTFGRDADFSEELFFDRYNGDLANDLGNTLSRVITMINKYSDGVIPKLTIDKLSDEDKTLKEKISNLNKLIEENVKNIKIHMIPQITMTLIRDVSKYLMKVQPWSLAKDENNIQIVQNCLRLCIDAIHKVAIAFYPIMPNKSKEILQAIGTNTDAIEFDKDIDITGNKIDKKINLFPRIEKPEKEESNDQVQKQSSKTKKDSDQNKKDYIEYNDFAKIKLKIGKILEAENVPKTDKLLKLQVDMGSEVRQILAGVAEHYKPEELLNQQVVVVSNLHPKKIRGIESNGMILFADNDNNQDTDKKLIMISPKQEVTNGSNVQ